MTSTLSDAQREALIAADLRITADTAGVAEDELRRHVGDRLTFNVERSETIVSIPGGPAVPLAEFAMRWREESLAAEARRVFERPPTVGEVERMSRDAYRQWRRRGGSTMSSNPPRPPAPPNHRLERIETMPLSQYKRARAEGSIR